MVNKNYYKEFKDSIVKLYLEEGRTLASITKKYNIFRCTIDTDDPKKYGKALKGNLKEYWIYRVGNYRVLADIKDDQIQIIIFNIGHRKDIYK